MPRYEFKDDKSNKFWEITIAGTEVTTNWGRIGTNGQSKTKSYDDEAAAQKDYEKQIASKTKKGYELAESGDAPAAPAAVSKSNPELEATIRDNPDDSAAYQVYGDWLSGEGDPLGEAVALQVKSDNSQESLKELIEANTEHFLGPVHEDCYEKELVFGEWDHYDKPEGWPDQSWGYGFSRTVWKNGFIHSLFYDTGYYDEEEERGSDVAAEPLHKMLALPSARFIREFTLGELWADYDEGEGPELGEAIKAIVAAPCAKTLRKLDIKGGEHDISGVSLDITGLAAACPNIEELSLYAGYFTIDSLDFPKLRRFALQTGGLSKEEFAKVTAVEFPLIEDLEIWFGHENYGATCTIEDVAPLVDRQMPNLKRLGLMNAEFGDDICKLIVKTPLLGQLEKLDLSMGIITDEGAQVLIDNADKLAHLEHLNIRGYFSEEVANGLRKLAKDRSIDGEDVNYQYRYVRVGE